MERDRNLFDRFGGVRPMADALGEAPSTVQSWKTTGRIPSTKQPEVLVRAAELGLSITAHDVVFPLICRPDALDATSHVGDVIVSVACDRPAVSHGGRAA